MKKDFRTRINPNEAMSSAVPRFAALLLIWKNPPLAFAAPASQRKR